LLAAIARHISIATIYTVGYLRIFNAGHFFQVNIVMVCKENFQRRAFFQVSIAMICEEKRIGLPWFSTNPQIMPLCT